LGHQKAAQNHALLGNSRLDASSEDNYYSDKCGQKVALVHGKIDFRKGRAFLRCFQNHRKTVALALLPENAIFLIIKTRLWETKKNQKKTKKKINFLLHVP